ncbi:MAG: integrase arm-type DNA-binding domain-containing protein [Burkholderiaceae bacterium]|jgi:integrase|nr:integrase arm-type DNA-binding domain-containing protein [Burkholderiaceae bacterium]
MATGALTDKAIRAAIKRAVDTGTAARLPDGDGLRLDVQPTGAAWWRLRYRFDGREGMLSLGTFPGVPLATARQRREQAHTMIASGVNPSEHRKAEKTRAALEAQAQAQADAGLPGPGSFEYVAREWFDHVHREKVSMGHAERTMIRFEQNVFPWLGRRPIVAVEAPELLAVLRRMEARGIVETAHRVKDACGQVFRYGISTGVCTRNPAADLRDALKPVLTRHYPAIIAPQQVGVLLRAMLDYRGTPTVRAALALSALLLLRPGEIRQLEWAWVDLDGAAITVPAAMMKRPKAGKANGTPHVVPLARQAVAILRDELWPLTGSGRYVFPSLQTQDRPMSENTVNVALRRMGFDQDTMTAHGFRAMARTMMAERLGIDPQVIEAQLAHDVPDALGRAYNRTQFLEQRRAMMARWADYLDRLREGAQVIPLRERAA